MGSFIIQLCIFLFFGIYSAIAASPAFECQKADGEVEKMICKDESLAALDVQLSHLFQMAKAEKQSEERSKEMLAMQRGWIKGRNDCWKSDDKHECIIDNYVSRIHELYSEYPKLKSDNQSGSLGPYQVKCPSLKSVAPMEITYINGVDDGYAYLTWGDRALVLKHAQSGSGTKYSRTYEDQEYVFWSKGADALLDTPEAKSISCSIDIK